jgi:aromatic ring-cleaving dioxygenase
MEADEKDVGPKDRTMFTIFSTKWIRPILDWVRRLRDGGE